MNGDGAKCLESVGYKALGIGGHGKKGGTAGACGG